MISSASLVVKEKYFEISRDFNFAHGVSIYSDPIFLGDYPKGSLEEDSENKLIEINKT